MNNERYHAGHHVRNTDLEKGMRKIGARYDKGKRKADMTFFKERNSAKRYLPTLRNTKRTKTTSAELGIKYQQRREALKHGRYEELRCITKQIRKQAAK